MVRAVRCMWPPGISVGVPPVSQELWRLGLGKSDLKTDLKDETQLF